MSASAWRTTSEASRMLAKYPRDSRWLPGTITRAWNGHRLLCGL
jgi:hypothetical protein